LAAKRAAHKETKDQIGLKVQGAKIAGIISTTQSAPKNKENTDAINKREQNLVTSSDSKSAHTTATKASTTYHPQTNQKTNSTDLTQNLDELE